MWAGFKFGLGFSLAALLVWSVVSFGDSYGRCALKLDTGAVPPPGHFCEWVAQFHKKP